MPGRFNIKTLVAHMSLWALYVALEYLANIYHINSGSEWRYLKSILLTLPLIMIPTYFLTLVVVPRFLRPGKVVATAVSFLLVIVFVFFGRVLWLDVMSRFDLALFKHIPIGKIFKNVIRDYSVIALAVCIYLLADWRRSQKLNEELITAKAEAELKLLKGQLHPHFLFNTLNNIYSLALTKSDLTADAILKLTELLDYLVYRANSNSVPLNKEVQLINTYLDLESLRHSDKLVIERSIELDNPDFSIAPLVMLPFVENCFKHGGVGADGIFSVDISIHFHDNVLRFYIRNSKRARVDEKGWADVNSGLLALNRGADSGGVGLENIDKRLKLIYPDKHELSIKQDDGYYTVNLIIYCADEI